jgi:1-acyl-sn-glycerol-3-phosphate acyltransferase
MLTEWIRERAEFFSGNNRTRTTASFVPSLGLRVQAGLRLASIVAVTFALFILWTLGDVASPGARRRIWRNWIVRRWATIMLRILGARLNIRGRLPDAPFCLVSNHLGYLDILVYLSLVDGVFVAKREVESWPLIGPLSRRAGTIYADRASRRDAVRLNRRIKECAQCAECGVILFPEGTSTAGDGVAPFKSSPLDFAAAADFPVHYAALSYQTAGNVPPPEESVCWWGDMGFLPHFTTLLHLPGVTVRVDFGNEPIRSNDRKTLAARLEQAVARSLAAHPMVFSEDE